MLTKPGWILRIEGAAMAVCAVCLYRVAGGGWILFLALFLWPDLLMLGYLANARWGAALYNLVHTDALPIALAGGSLGMHWTSALTFSLIWLAHIGWDRMLGYGLKYPTFFKDTHLQRLDDMPERAAAKPA